MSDLNYDDAIKMFGTKEQIEAWERRKEVFKEWMKDIPLYEPEYRIGEVRKEKSNDQ